MSNLILSTTMTVDAVVDVGEWYVAGGEHDRAARHKFVDAAGLVLGRKTFEGLAAYWPPLEDEWANLLNPMPKFVASRTLQEPLEWNAKLIEGDVAEGVSKLKDELDGDLLLIGCGELARHLVSRGLIDELRFWVHPAAWGRGERPFQGEEQVQLQLLGSETFDSGVTLLRYQPTSGQ